MLKKILTLKSSNDIKKISTYKSGPRFFCYTSEEQITRRFFENIIIQLTFSSFLKKYFFDVGKFSVLKNFTFLKIFDFLKTSQNVGFSKSRKTSKMSIFFNIFSIQLRKKNQRDRRFWFPGSYAGGYCFTIENF